MTMSDVVPSVVDDVVVSGLEAYTVTTSGAGGAFSVVSSGYNVVVSGAGADVGAAAELSAASSAAVSEALSVVVSSSVAGALVDLGGASLVVVVSLSFSDSSVDGGGGGDAVSVSTTVRVVSGSVVVSTVTTPSKPPLMASATAAYTRTNFICRKTSIGSLGAATPLYIGGSCPHGVGGSHYNLGYRSQPFFFCLDYMQVLSG